VVFRGFDAGNVPGKPEKIRFERSRGCPEFRGTSVAVR
jgi:hypothetical protein